VGLNGSTNPSFVVNDSTAAQAAGLSVTGAATGGTVAVATIDSGSNTNLTINAKGTGTIGIGSVSTGAVTITPATTISAALTYGGVTLSNSVSGTGSMALSSSPTFVTPTLGAALATSINGLTITSSTGTLTIANSKTHTINNTITLAGTDSTTWTGASSNMTLAALNLADQVVTGGANVTSVNLGTITGGGTINVDCGTRQSQYAVNNATSSWTIAAPGAGKDGSCIILVTNNSSGTLVAPTFSGFSPNSGVSGDTYLTANNDQFSLFIWQVNGVAGYRWAAMQ
jgi:hypothetical protein